MSVEDTTEAVLEEIVKSEEIDKEDPTPSLVVTGNGLEEATNRDEFETLEDQSTKSFPQRLLEILSNDSHSDIISWCAHGNGFRIHKKKQFANDILPKYFKASKFTSFTRKLNRWGFSRIPRGPETGSYFHKFFQRDKPELCSQMTSNSGNKYSSTPAMHNQILPAVPGIGPRMYPFMQNPGMMMGQNGMMPNGGMVQPQQQAMWQQMQMQMMQMQQQMQMMQSMQGQQSFGETFQAPAEETDDIVHNQEAI